MLNGSNFQDLKATSSLSAPCALLHRFGMCLGQGGGSLVLGDSDPKMYHGKLSYVNAAKKHYYSIMARRTPHAARVLGSQARHSLPLSEQRLPSPTI